MDERDWIKKLDVPQSAPPAIDVANRVMRDLRMLQRRDDSSEPSLGLAAWLSAAVAIVTLIFAVQAWSTFTDPLGNLVTSLTTVLQ